MVSALTADPASLLEFTSKKRSIPTINELAVVTSKLNYMVFAKSLYPELSDEGLKQLQSAVKQYLIQKQFVQQLERSIAVAYDPERLNALGQMLAAERAYALDDPHASAYLYIETTLNIKMRPDQIENLNKFIAGAEGSKEIVLQMIMGAGKTSVLQPILGFLFARPDALSVVDVPEALFETVVKELPKALGNVTQYVYTMPYERTMAKDVNFLKAFYQTITEAKDKGAAFLRTPKVKHSIVTSLYEAYHDGNVERIEMIGKIISFLQMNEIVQIDEIDMTMNAKIIFKYPVGNPKAIDVTKATLVSDLLLDAATDPDLMEAVSLDFVDAFHRRYDASYKKQGVSLTVELFEDVVQPRLVELALDRLKKSIPGLSDKLKGREYLRKFLTQQKPQHAGTKEMNAWVERNFPDPAARELLGAAADAVKNILPTSLFKECGSHYGKDKEPGKYVARPYDAPKAPKTSVYAQPYEQVVYSTQMALYYGLPPEAAGEMLSRLQKEARNEIKHSVLLADTDAFKKFQMLMGAETSYYDFFQEPPEAALIEAFTQAASRDRECIGEFLRTTVFPQIKLFEESISSTPQTLAGSSKLAFGYTGTLHPGILSPTQEAIAEEGTDGKTVLAIESKMKSGRATTKVFSDKAGTYLDQMIGQITQDKDLCVFIDSGGWLKEETVKAFAKRLLAQVQIARPEIKGVVYHNGAGQIVSLEPESEGSCELVEVPLSASRYKTTEGQQLTIIAQRYETGTNIPQKPNAKAVMSIRKGMTKRDGLQSAFRMRQILAQQSVSFAMTEDVKNAIASGICEGLFSREDFKRQFLEDTLLLDNLPEKCKKELAEAFEQYRKISNLETEKAKIYAFSKCFSNAFIPDSEDIWRYWSTNEALLKREKTWDSAKHKMREVIEKPLRLLLSDAKLPVTLRMQAFSLFKTFLIEHTPDSSFAKIVQESITVDPETAIKSEIEKNLNFLDLLKNNAAVSDAYIAKGGSRAEIKAKLDTCVKAEDLAPRITVTATATDQELEQEEEQEQEQEQEQEVKQEREDRLLINTKAIENKKYNDLVKMDDGYRIEEFFNKSFSKLSEVLPSDLRLPDDNIIEFSENLFIDKAGRLS